MGKFQNVILFTHHTHTKLHMLKLRYYGIGSMNQMFECHPLMIGRILMRVGQTKLNDTTVKTSFLTHCVTFLYYLRNIYINSTGVFSQAFVRIASYLHHLTPEFLDTHPVPTQFTQGCIRVNPRKQGYHKVLNHILHLWGRL